VRRWSHPEGATAREEKTVQTLQQWAQDNYETIGFIVVTLGNTALKLGVMGIELATPFLQELVNNH
jgi:hypothetical protein